MLLERAYNVGQLSVNSGASLNRFKTLLSIYTMDNSYRFDECICSVQVQFMKEYMRKSPQLRQAFYSVTLMVIFLVSNNANGPAYRACESCLSVQMTYTYPYKTEVVDSEARLSCCEAFWDLDGEVLVWWEEECVLGILRRVWAMVEGGAQDVGGVESGAVKRLARKERDSDSNLHGSR